MRADTARRCADVINGFLAWRVGAGVLGSGGVVEVVRLDDPFAFAGAEAVGVIAPAAARFGFGVGAISMPNIPERSWLSSTFAVAGPFRVFERSDPAFAIKSC